MVANNNKEVRTTYFVLYEYKSGLIKRLIDYYYLVDLYDTPTEAFNKWSERFSARDTKNFIIIHGLILKLNQGIDGDKKAYLSQLEGAINHVIDLFDLGINNWKAGSFSRDEVVRFEIKSTEDYPPFRKLLNNRKTIPLAKFWEKNRKELNKIVGNKNNSPKEFKNKYDLLEKVNNDYSFSDKFQANKSLGDSVICVDVSANDILVTMDKFQNHLRQEVLGRDCLLVAKKQD